MIANKQHFTTFRKIRNRKNFRYLRYPKIHCNQEIVAIDKLLNSVYVINMRILTPNSQVEANLTTSEDQLQRWHEQLGHQDKRHVRNVLCQTHAALACLTEALQQDLEPTKFREAMESHDSDKWLCAMKENMKAFEENETWDLVPPNMREYNPDGVSRIFSSNSQD